MQPAFTVRVDIDAGLPVGGQAGRQLVIVVSFADLLAARRVCFDSDEAHVVGYCQE